jgi:aryl-phospho-beta-D-glucosidase BglC (GH1 family)
MRPHDRFVTLTLVAFTAASLIASRPAQAASTASDNACNSPYNGTTWSNGQNGGTGFGTWSLFQSGGGTSSFFTSSSGINNNCNGSWGEFAGSGATANARRTFTGSPSALVTNQIFTFSIDNGYVDTAGAIGVALENSSSNTVWEFLYIGGNNGGYYAINDGSGTNDTPITYTENGLTVVFTLTSSATYSVQITALGGSSSISNGILKSPAGGQGISQFRFYNYEPSHGNNANYNCYLNTISVGTGSGCPAFTVSAPGNQSVCVGNTASFSVTAGVASSPTYQWQVSTNGGSTWNPVSSGTGGTTTNYTTAATVAGDNGNLYLCAVTDACSNTINSAAATLSVNSTASITSQPTAQTGYVGGSVNFTIGALATSYQWYEGPTGSGVALSNGGSVNGATTSTLTLSSLATNETGANFYVVVNGCGGPPQTSNGAGLTVLAAVDPFLKANGRNIRNGHGNGDIIQLHGANLGSWLLMEGWMSPMDSGSSPDCYSAISELDSRFGVTAEQSLIRTYQYNWIVTNDLDKVRALGMNLIRVPFWWGNVETLAGAWRADAFDRLDWVVSNAWERGIYVVIDFHGVPGGQSTSQDTGQENQNQYWTSTADQAATAMIWSNVAAHYVGNPAVAAYDLMNEPSGAPTQLALWYMYTNLYQVVRSVDPDHICLMEGTWNGTGTNTFTGMNEGLNWQWDVLPPPTMFGWSNVVYSMHSYAGSGGSVPGEVSKQTSDYVNHYSWNVPDYIGEFQGYTPGSEWELTITNYDEYAISWSTWAFKAANGAGQNWGIYYNGSLTGPDLETSSNNVISNAWVQCQTADGFSITSYEQQYLGGPLAVANSYTATSDVALVVGAGSGVLGNAIDINEGQPGIQLTAVLVNGPGNGQLSFNTNGSFSYTPNAGFSGTDTFRYQVYDNWQLSVNIATATITVIPGSQTLSAFQQWQFQYFGCSNNCPPQAQPNADPLGKGMSNTNQFLAGFNPTNSAAYLHIISIATANSTNMNVIYLGANGDDTWSPGVASRTNVLDYTPGDGGGDYTNGGWEDTGQTNILSGGTGTGIVTNMVDAGGATNTPSRYYRVRVLLP